MRKSWLARRATFFFLVIIVALGGLSAYLGVQNYGLRQELTPVVSELASTTEAYQQLTSTWRDKFLVVTQRNDLLTASLSQEQLKSIEFQAQINGIQGSVDYLKKLSETDKELLQKYSKVYFLNENYVPSSLSVINVTYTYGKKELEIHTKVWPYLQRLIDDARAAGIRLDVASAYRSFGYQGDLKSDYKVTYGTGANKFSADQGYSEHQLGSAVDFTTDALNGGLTGFDKATAYTWLQNNAYKYGFELSYPKGNAYYVFEPWHWRFVGVALATRLHNENKNFYDMDQRDIDQYLALIFD